VTGNLRAAFAADVPACALPFVASSARVRIEIGIVPLRDISAALSTHIADTGHQGPDRPVSLPLKPFRSCGTADEHDQCGRNRIPSCYEQWTIVGTM